MDNHDICSILLNLHSRLSDNDRERLHLYLKNDVPRPVQDDSSFGRTLKNIQALFDQDKISEEDFSLLIDAFKHIRCFDAVHLLEEYQRRTLSSGLNQSTQNLALIMPSKIQECPSNDEDEHSDATEDLILNEIKPNDDKNDNIDGNNPAVIENTKRRSPSRKPCFCVPLLKNKYFLWPFILFLLTLGTLFIVLVERNNLIDNLKDKLRMKEDFIPKTKNQNNQTVKDSNKTLTDLDTQNNQTVNELNNLSSEKPTTIAQLNTTLPELDNKNNQTVKQTGNSSSTKFTTTTKGNTTPTTVDKQNKQTGKQNNNLSSEKPTTIAQLNTTLPELDNKNNQTVKQTDNSSSTKSTTAMKGNTTPKKGAKQNTQTVKPKNNLSSEKTPTTAPLKTILKHGRANVLN